MPVRAGACIMPRPGRDLLGAVAPRLTLLELIRRSWGPRAPTPPEQRMPAQYLSSRNCRCHSPHCRIRSKRAARSIWAGLREMANEGPFPLRRCRAANLAHGFAPAANDKADLAATWCPISVSIPFLIHDQCSRRISHFETYPELIRKAALQIADAWRRLRAAVAGHVTGVTQGQPRQWSCPLFLARRDRHGGGGGAVAQHVCAAGLSRRLRH